MKSIVSRALCAAGALVIATGGALAQQVETAAQFPSRSIRLVVSAAAGGGNDLIARIVSERLQARWNQTVTVENRPGAGNNIAAEFVFRAPPDGYTLLVSPPAPLVVNAALFKELRFDPKKMEPVAVSSSIPNMLVVRGNAPWKTAKEFIAFARENPGKLSYASQGNGTTGHLTGALFEMLIGAKHAHVPYSGAAPALNDLAANHVDFMFADIGTIMPLAQAGKVHMLAATMKETPKQAPACRRSQKLACHCCCRTRGRVHRAARHAARHPAQVCGAIREIISPRQSLRASTSSASSRSASGQRNGRTRRVGIQALDRCRREGERASGAVYRTHDVLRPSPLRERVRAEARRMRGREADSPSSELASQGHLSPRGKER